MTRDTDNQIHFLVRHVNIGDAPAVARLCCQLGYPSETGEIEVRLSAIRQDAEHEIFVAENKQGIVVGWVDVYLRRPLVADLHAMIGGLVVDADHRRLGIGHLLLNQAEAWGRSHGAPEVYVRSNMIRIEAHKFYEHLGYECAKKSYLFIKKLR